MDELDVLLLTPGDYCAPGMLPGQYGIRALGMGCLTHADVRAAGLLTAVAVDTARPDAGVAALAPIRL